MSMGNSIGPRGRTTLRALFLIMEMTLFVLPPEIVRGKSVQRRESNICKLCARGNIPSGIFSFCYYWLGIYVVIYKKDIYELERKDVVKISIADIAAIVLLILAPCVGIAAIIYGIVGLRKLLNGTVKEGSDIVMSDIDN